MVFYWGKVFQDHYPKSCNQSENHIDYIYSMYNVVVLCNSVVFISLSGFTFGDAYA